MGDPRKIRRKYDKPAHPWQRIRLEEEKAVDQAYGLKNKKDIWRMSTMLRGFKNQVKALSSRFDDQSKLEEQQLVNRLISLGLMKQGDSLDKILGLQLKDIADRRLQTLLVKKGLARSMKQSRQFITHGHVLVNKKKITFPSYIVGISEEQLIEFVPTSSLSREDHPERIIKETKEKVVKKKKEDKEDLPAFAVDEIVQIEETGLVEKKAAEKKAADEAAAKKAEKPAETEEKAEEKKEAPKEAKKEPKKAAKKTEKKEEKSE